MTDSSAVDAGAAPDHPASDACWAWTRGGSAVVVNIEGDSLTVHSTVAYPPGAPLGALSDNRTSFEMKVRTCRKLSPSGFEISGKLVNATRALRERLTAAVAAKSDAQR